MHIIVVGCGRVGAQLAYHLDKAGHEVVVIDTDGAAFARLPLDFRGRSLEGQVLSKNVLRRAEVERADALAAVTRSDTINAVTAHVARTLFQVPRVIARNYDPRFLPVHRAFGLESVSSTVWGAQQVEDLLLREDVVRVLSVGDGRVGVYEIRVPASWNGHQVRNILPAGESVAISLSRSGKTRLASEDTTLAEGDILHLSATDAGIEHLRGRLSKEV